MNELSIVQELFKICETNAMKQRAKKVLKVEVRLGRLSGVEPHYLESAFDAFKHDTICSEAQLVIELQEVVIKCLDCSYQGLVLDNSFRCSRCDSLNIKIVEGEDLYLMKLDMSDD